MTSAKDIQRFKEAMHLVYGPLESVSEESVRTWFPPEQPGAAGHRGRYLWTDAFGVLNFITLAKESSSPLYLSLAGRLVQTVHSVLGSTRDGTTRLPLATDEEPLKGGLRIGKMKAHGSDCDGQYHHYLTLWMFALNRLSLATGEKMYNELAVQLAKAIHGHFVQRIEGGSLRMVWKISTDMQTILVPSEGHLDATTGFVVYQLIQQTAEHFKQEGAQGDILKHEIGEYRQLMNRVEKLKASSDSLDLGMGLWMAHWYRDEDWARTLGIESLEKARLVLDDKRGLMVQKPAHRLAFREFGLCLGLRCWGCDDWLRSRLEAVINFWQDFVEDPTDQDLRPITLAMYAAALIPGAFQEGYSCFRHVEVARNLAGFHTTTSDRQGTARKFPAIFARGGTSNGLVIQRRDLPSEHEWPSVLAPAMGSPDPYGRQLNGMGSGISSTSKICILSPSSRPDADVDFTFVQVGVKDGALDMAGNCGNMLSVIGPVSLDEGIIAEPLHIEPDAHGEPHTALVRIFNTNTEKVIHSRFSVAGNPPRYQPGGHYEMDGVPGKQSHIVLSFVDPAGAKTGRALPTGNPVDTLSLPSGGTIEASLVDVSNPGVFIRATDLGVPDLESLSPATVESNPALKARLEEIRGAGAEKMGLDPKIQSVPKIVMIFPPPQPEVSPRINIKCLALSMGQAHKAAPLTLALCLGAAARMPGTIPHELTAGQRDSDVVVIGHPTGSLDVGTTLEDGKIVSAQLHRTARILMKGEVHY
ncbi:hypothetical protein OQA88_136 [Cercophora sp. LCS_1]